MSDGTESVTEEGSQEFVDDVILNLGGGIFWSALCLRRLVQWKRRRQDPDLMNKKSLWLKGDWFVSSWVTFYSALEKAES